MLICRRWVEVISVNGLSKRRMVAHLGIPWGHGGQLWEENICLALTQLVFGCLLNLGANGQNFFFNFPSFLELWIRSSHIRKVGILRKFPI